MVKHAPIVAVDEDDAVWKSKVAIVNDPCGMYCFMYFHLLSSASFLEIRYCLRWAAGTRHIRTSTPLSYGFLVYKSTYSVYQQCKVKH